LADAFRVFSDKCILFPYISISAPTARIELLLVANNLLIRCDPNPNRASWRMRSLTFPTNASFSPIF
jgi:hypothetical protein